jgi:hypothetical protein
MKTEIQTLEQQLKPLAAQVSELFDTFQILATAEDRFDSDEYDPDFPRCARMGSGDILARCGMCQYAVNRLQDYDYYHSEFLDDLISNFKGQFTSILIVAMDSDDNFSKSYISYFGNPFSCIQHAYLFSRTAIEEYALEFELEDEGEEM